jgi:prepilin-type N-terminal cleavage/methylation domain-containing protein
MRPLRLRSRPRGFTLLEVLVAVSILGLGLTVILSSQVGLFSSSQRAQNLSLATHLARCRMNEEEVELLKTGYPLADETRDEGPCCEEESDTHFRCTVKVERIELPQPAGMGGDDGGIDLMGEPGIGALGADGGALSPVGPSSMGPLGALANLQNSGGAALGGGNDLSSLSGYLGEASAGGGVQGLASLAMGLVYPSLKLMLEASIRKVTVTVEWKEGRHERDLQVTQYVTNPMQGVDPNAEKGLEALEQAAGALGGSTPGTGAGTPGTTPEGE